MPVADLFVDTVRFNANTSPELPWQFHPLQPSVTLKLGDEAIATYRLVTAESGRFPEIGRALYERGFQRGTRRGFLVLAQVARLHAGTAMDHQQRRVQRGQHARGALLDHRQQHAQAHPALLVPARRLRAVGGGVLDVEQHFGFTAGDGGVASMPVLAGAAVERR